MTVEEDAKRERAGEGARETEATEGEAPAPGSSAAPDSTAEPRAPFDQLAMSGAEAAAIEARDGDDAEHDVSPVALEEQQRFAIREGGRTVGAGIVTKILQ